MTQSRKQVKKFIALQDKARRLTDEYLGSLPEVISKEGIREKYESTLATESVGSSRELAGISNFFNDRCRLISPNNLGFILWENTENEHLSRVPHDRDARNFDFRQGTRRKAY